MGDVINFYAHVRPWDNGNTGKQVLNDLEGNPVLQAAASKHDLIDGLLEEALLGLACNICEHIAQQKVPDISLIQDYKIKITSIMEMKNET